MNSKHILQKKLNSDFQRSTPVLRLFFNMKYSSKKIISIIIITVFSVFVLFFYRCPIKLIFGFDCPGCGMTRALKSALMLDFKGAFEYHPMFFIFAAEAVYYVFSRYILKKRLSDKTEQIVLISTIILTIIVWIIRLFYN